MPSNETRASENKKQSQLSINDFPALTERDLSRLYILLGREAQMRVTAVLLQELWAASDATSQPPVEQ
jgi:hypothetical protein